MRCKIKGKKEKRDLEYQKRYVPNKDLKYLKSRNGRFDFNKFLSSTF